MPSPSMNTGDYGAALAAAERKEAPALATGLDPSLVSANLRVIVPNNESEVIGMHLLPL